MTNPNDDVIAEFRANSGTVTQAMGGALAGLDLALLHHPGRSSGTAYITPVAYMAYGDSYLLLGSFAGAATEPQWVRNVESTPEITVEMGTRTTTMTPTVLRDGPQRDRLYEAAGNTGPSCSTTSSGPPGPFPSSGWNRPGSNRP